MVFIVKNTTIINIFDLIAPHSCRGCGQIGEVLCNRCKKNIISSHHNICPSCKRVTKNGKCSKCKNLPPTFVVGDRDSIIGELIKDYKYNSTRALSRPLAELLDAILPQTGQKTIIVPLPTIDKHIRSRGLDHTYLLAKKLAKLRHYSIEKLFSRTNSSVQVGADKKTRLIQAETTYSLTPNFKPDQDARYLLLDDVWTTGASMQACVKKLQQAGVKNIQIALLAVSKLD